MRTIHWLPAAAVAVSMPFLMGQACSLFGTPALSQDDLTALEGTAIQAAAMKAAGALTQATSTAQSPVRTEGDPAGQGVVFGSCPVVTLAANPAGEEDLALTLTVDFGTGCVPPGLTGYTCSGSATGSFSSTSKHIGVAFHQITCNSRSLAGSADVNYTIGATGVNLDGSFNLTWTAEGEATTVAGQGIVGYDNSAKASTIATFNGSISGAGGTYTVSFADVVVSYQNNANLIPSAGVITLSGAGLRTLTIRFDANSPSTGQVEVSIAGGPFFSVDLNAL